ncbi:MAG TPA: hypothetical protein V6C76_17245 [Drouetiella sp.]
MPPLQRILAATLAAACLQILCVNADASERKAVVRVTTGSVQIDNWQHDLVKDNPNLGHWHWNPIYANTQGLKAIGVKAQPDRYRHNGGPHQIHPNTTVQAIKPRPGSVYIRPNHIPFNTSRKTDNNNSNNIAGVLRSPNVSANLSHRDVSANLRQSQVNAQLASRDVNARLTQNPNNMHPTQGPNTTRTTQPQATRPVNVVSESPQAPTPLPTAPPKAATYGDYYGGNDDFSAISLKQHGVNNVTKSSVSARIATQKRPSKSAPKKSSLGY